MTTYGIVGSRNWRNLELVEKVVAGLLPDSVVVSGGARGVDRIAERAARRNDLRVISYRPRENAMGTFSIEIWEDEHHVRTHGRIFSGFAPAAFFRNGLIVEDADILIAFQRENSAGTGDTIEKATKAGVPVDLWSEDR